MMLELQINLMIKIDFFYYETFKFNQNTIYKFKKAQFIHNLFTFFKPELVVNAESKDKRIISHLKTYKLKYKFRTIKNKEKKMIWVFT